MAADSTEGQCQQLPAPKGARVDPEGENPDPREVANMYQGLSGLRGSPFLGKCCWFHTWAVTQAPDSIPVLSLTQRVAPGRTRSYQTHTLTTGKRKQLRNSQNSNVPSQCGVLALSPHSEAGAPRAPALTPSPAAFGLTGSPSCMRHPDAVGTGTAAHTLHTAGTFPAALPGRAGEEEMGMGWQVHTSSALLQLSPAPSHPAHHMPAHTHPPSLCLPQAPSQTHSRKGGKKSSK